MNRTTARPLAERLRKSLVAARANLQIRDQLRALVDDPSRIDPIVRELGPRHAVVLELFLLAHGAEDHRDVA